MAGFYRMTIKMTGAWRGCGHVVCDGDIGDDDDNDGTNAAWSFMPCVAHVTWYFYGN